MADLALSEDQQLKNAYAEMVAQSQVIKKRLVHLEKKNTENQTRLKELNQERRDASEHFSAYQKQTKEEKERSETK